MPKYYCDYCDTYLTHDSPSVRKTHCTGRKHRDNVKFYYQKWMEEQAQHLIDATTAAFKAGKIAQNPFAAPPPKVGSMGDGRGGVQIPPPGQLGGPPPGMPPMMMGGHGQMPPPMMGMGPPPSMMGGPPMMGPPPGMGMRPPPSMGQPMKN